MWFFKKKNLVIRWEFKENSASVSKVVVAVNGVRPFEESFFGVKNSPASNAYVPCPVEVSGVIHEASGRFPEAAKESGEDLEKRGVTVLIPEPEIEKSHEKFAPGDCIVLWLSDRHRCFKFEKVSM